MTSKRPLDDNTKLNNLAERYPDLNPSQLSRALEIKRLYLKERGPDGARSYAEPQDLAVQIVKLEAEKGIELSLGRATSLMFALGVHLEGSSGPNLIIEQVFKEQNRDNLKISTINQTIADSVSSQVGKVY